MLVECLGCGAKLHTEDKLQEGSTELTCDECNSVVKIEASIVKQEDEVSKAAGLLQDVSTGTDIDMAISLYLGDE